MRVVAVLVLVLLFSNVVCPLHYNAACYSTGQYRNMNGRGFVLYHCSCGDEYWIAQ